MRKSEAINTFDQGLVMDINPLVAPNDGVCNALNATLITMNGNENVLQNDMGNGRVETAYLPEGYVPLGTAELEGIIYIVSYNPLNKKCQIGSFPSPERNISSDEVSDLNQVLTNDDFKYRNETGALVYYLKKELNEGLTFNPGDKFIVYGDKIDANFANLYDETSYDQSLYNDSLYDQSLSEEEIKKKIQEAIEIIKNHTLKLDIGTVTDTGKLVKFENLKQYNIGYKDTTDTTEDTTDTTKKIQGKYHIFQYSGKDNQAPNLDEYRSLVSQPYNIFSSKISGSLVLIAELVQFNDFDVQLENAFTISNGHKMYAPKATFTFSGDYPFIPKGVIGEISLTNGTDPDITSTFEYTISDSDISSQLSKDNTFYEVKLEEILKDEVKSEGIQENLVLKKIREIAESGYFDSGERNAGYVIKYKFTPCMNWGPISYLAVTGQIDLDKLGTGYIEISQWRYYNEPNKCNLTWGLEIYEEEGYSVDKVEMDFTRFTKFIKSNSTELSPENYSTETVTYKVNNKASYFGVFYDVLPINEDYYSLTGRLKPNCLYLVKIKVTYVSSDEARSSSEPREFYRWLYTNTVFNQHYADTDDFQVLRPDFTPSVKGNYSVESSEGIVEAYGIIKQEVEGLSNEEKAIARNTSSSLSAIQTNRGFSIQGDLTIGLVQDYNTFYLQTIQDAFDISLDSDSFKCSSSSVIKYSDAEDPNQEEYLKSEGLVVDSEDPNEYLKYTLLGTSGQDNSATLLEIPTHVVKKGKFNLKSFSDNTYNFMVSCLALQTVKAYCTKIISTLTYKGRFIPLAYNRETFQNYNLEWDTDAKKWLPFTIGLFGFRENPGSDGRVHIGGWNKENGDSDWIEVERGDHVSLHWTTDPDIPPAQRDSGWSGTAMFFIHKWGGSNHESLYNWSDVSNIPQNSGGVYSIATEQNTDKSRAQLSFKSNNGDNFFYPVNCSAVGTGNNDISKMRSIPKFSDLFHAFAQYLNNIYRYDPQEISQQCIIPYSLYWMDECKYSISTSLNIQSTDSLNKCGIYLMLDEGKIKLSSMITSLRSAGCLKEQVEYPTLQNNISSTIQSINDKFTLSIVNSDNKSGIEMRNYMLDCMRVAPGVALMDYNGTSILTTVSTSSDNKSLYMREDTNGKPNVTKATSFVPKNITYTEGDDHKIVPSVDTSALTEEELNLNRYFVLNEDNMLVLKDPRKSEHSFKRAGGDDEGIADGYQKVCILSAYKSY